MPEGFPDARAIEREREGTDLVAFFFQGDAHRVLFQKGGDATRGVDELVALAVEQLVQHARPE